MFKLLLVESERGWGQKYWTEDFGSLELAREEMEKVNAKNTSPTAPDWYIAALEIRDPTGKVVG